MNSIWLAGAPLPPDEAYEDYGQIDDGVGMLRLLETEYLRSARCGGATRLRPRAARSC